MLEKRKNWMPKYDYCCKICGFVFEYRHQMSETLERHPDCKQEECQVEKVPSFHRHFIKIQDKKGRKPGDLVKKHIEETKEEIKQQKLNLQKEWEK